MVVAVVTPVVFCAKATEKRNENTKNSWWLLGDCQNWYKI
jgi:hypothetical protein